MSRTTNRSHWSIIAALALIGGLLLAFLLLLGLWLGTSYNAANRQIADRAEAGAKIVATNAGWIDALARQALRRMDEAMGPEIKRPASNLTSDLAEAVKGLPGRVKAYVVDENGNTLYSTDPKVRPINITDRDYFKRPQAGEEWFVSSLMVSRLSGDQIFAFSKRMTRAGQFRGVAVISFDVIELKAIWESVDLGPDSLVSLVRRDGQLVGQYPMSDGPVDMSSYLLFTDYLKKGDFGAYLTVPQPDQTARIVGYRRVPDTDFVALVSINQRDQLAEFWRNTTITLSFTLPAALGFAAAAFWVYRLMQIDMRRQALIEKALRQNKLLLGEIHHRVKNNLQAVQSLIRLQDLPPAQRLDLSNRLAAMVAVHEHIYRNDRYSEISVRDLLPSVVGLLVQAYSAKFDVGYELEDIYVTDEHATPLALLVNEVCTNSIKYGAPDSGRGRLDIRMRAIETGEIELSIADNGPGFDPDSMVRGMGSRLIDGVIAQLQGHYHYDMEGGARFVAVLAPTNLRLGRSD